MGWPKCFLGVHQWGDVTSLHKASLYETDGSKRPYAIRYSWMQRCDRCGRVKIFSEKVAA